MSSRIDIATETTAAGGLGDVASGGLGMTTITTTITTPCGVGTG